MNIAALITSALLAQEPGASGNITEDEAGWSFRV